NGAEVCRKLRGNPRTAHIPVLILSIRETEEMLKEISEAGAVGFVRKHDGREMLLESVARVLGVPRRRHVRVSCMFTVGISEGGKPYSGIVQNVSASGMFLTAAKRFEPGMALRVKFNLPGTQGDVQVLGEVVRTEEISDTDHGFGIQFLE